MTAGISSGEHVLVLPSFTFEGGRTLTGVRIGYAVHGVLDDTGSNAVLLMPGTTNTRHSADGYIGPGNALDPAIDCIIAVDAIGAGTSSQPSDGLGGDFPAYTIRDMVRLHAALLEELGITRLKAVVGASMGAFQALEWLVNYPGIAERAVLLVPAARAGTIFRAIVATMIEIIALDPDWNEGRYDRQPLAGLRAAGRAYFPWTVTDQFLETRPREVVEDALRSRIRLTADWDAWNVIRRYQASASHDVAAPFGGDMARALSRIDMPVLLLPSTSDRLLALDSAREIARHVSRAVYHEIPSEWGHLAWRAIPGSAETRFITDKIKNFMTGGHR